MLMRRFLKLGCINPKLTLAVPKLNSYHSRCQLGRWNIRNHFGSKIVDANHLNLFRHRPLLPLALTAPPRWESFAPLTTYNKANVLSARIPLCGNSLSASP